MLILEALDLRAASGSVSDDLLAAMIRTIARKFIMQSLTLRCFPYSIVLR